MLQGISKNGDWKIMPGQDRGCGDVKTYKLTPEELEKYTGDTNKKKVKTIKLDTGNDVIIRRRIDGMESVVTKESLIEMCRELGTGKEACKEIAKRVDLSPKTIENRIYKLNIHNILRDEKDVKEKIEGVGKDVEMVVNESGGKQSRLDYRFDLIDSKAIFALAKVLDEGEKRYGKDNWRKIEAQSHINHAISHLYAHLTGDNQDEHLEHAFCRVMMAVATR